VKWFMILIETLDKIGVYVVRANFLMMFRVLTVTTTTTSV